MTAEYWMLPGRDGTEVPVQCPEAYQHGEHPSAIADGEAFLCPGNPDGRMTPHQLARHLAQGGQL